MYLHLLPLSPISGLFLLVIVIFIHRNFARIFFMITNSEEPFLCLENAIHLTFYWLSFCIARNKILYLSMYYKLGRENFFKFWFPSLSLPQLEGRPCHVTFKTLILISMSKIAHMKKSFKDTAYSTNLKLCFTECPYRMSHLPPHIVKDKMTCFIALWV